MREHPIPQDLTGYRFHIIGNMTLKQFTEIAVGVVIGVILYNTNLVAVVKWPLILVSVGLGAMIAWVPFEERPLDHWFTTFFTVLYRPTKFFWRKKNEIPLPFLFKPRPDQVNVAEEVDLMPARQARTKEYITTVELTQPKEAWEDEEDQKIAQVLGHFDTVQVNEVVAKKTIHKPDLGVRVRELQDITHTPETVTPVQVHFSPAPEPEPTPAPESIPLANSVATDEVPLATSAPVAIPVQAPVVPVIMPPNQPATVEPEVAAPASVVSADFMQTAPTPVPPQIPTETIVTNNSLPFPTTPTQPNKLVGMVLDADHKILTDTIVEIKNLQGLVARAVKTNALGQFFITTPLESGSYIVSADKPGYQFTSQQLVLSGQIVPPLQITAVGNGG